MKSLNKLETLSVIGGNFCYCQKSKGGYNTFDLHTDEECEEKYHENYEGRGWCCIGDWDPMKKKRFSCSGTKYGE